MSSKNGKVTGKGFAGGSREGEAQGTDASSNIVFQRDGSVRYKLELPGKSRDFMEQIKHELAAKFDTVYRLVYQPATIENSGAAFRPASLVSRWALDSFETGDIVVSDQTSHVNTVLRNRDGSVESYYAQYDSVSIEDVGVPYLEEGRLGHLPTERDGLLVLGFTNWVPATGPINREFDTVTILSRGKTPGLLVRAAVDIIDNIRADQNLTVRQLGPHEV